MAYERVSPADFARTFGTETELSSAALGSAVVAVSDEFFAAAANLLTVEPAPSLKGQFGPRGALYSGWETRRHNPAHDWCIIKFGAAGLISGFDIDTAHFNGNEAPAASVAALLDVGDGAAPPGPADPRWIEILPRVPLGPDARHLFKLAPAANEKAYNYVKLSMYPDGGIARFRAYGLIRAVFPGDARARVDLAHVFSGGRVVYVSDQHFGVGANLLLPGRGKDMGDGWETRRSRTPGHKCWVVIKLGEPGYLETAEIDTAHFMGNFPESCELAALYTTDILPTADDDAWTPILPRTQLGPHRQHYFQLENVAARVFSHVRVTIFPDGGLKRVRLVGRRASAPATAAEADGHVVLATPEAVGKGGSYVVVDGEPPKREPAPSSANGEGRYTLNGAHGTITPASPRSPVKSSAPSYPASAPPSAPAPIYAPTPSTPTPIPALPLTPEAFAPFGHVVQAFAFADAAPRGVRVTQANQGSAAKFHALAPVLASYPPELAARAGTALSVFRCAPVGLDSPGDGSTQGGWEMKVRLLERHPYTNQAFVPMGVGCGAGLRGEDALPEHGRAYLVVVAKNGEDDKPDLRTLRAFVAGAGQGVVYATGIWHHPMVALEKTIDFTCVETQIGDGSAADCEIVELDASEGLPRVEIPVF